jgi:hypothetical protein
LNRRKQLRVGQFHTLDRLLFQCRTKSR